MKWYLVAWTIKTESSNLRGKPKFTEHYDVFDDKENALRKYESLLTKEDLYCADLGEIIKSTDHEA